MIILFLILLMIIIPPFAMYHITNRHNEEIRKHGKCPGCDICGTGSEIDLGG